MQRRCIFKFIVFFLFLVHFSEICCKLHDIKLFSRGSLLLKIPHYSVNMAKYLSNLKLNLKDESAEIFKINLRINISRET